MWVEAHSDNAIFEDVEAWAAPLLRRAEAEGPEAVQAENDRLKEARDALLEETKFFAARLMNEVLKANRRSAPAIKPRLDRVEHELRKEVRRAYLRRLHLLMLLDEETLSEGVGHALMRILQEAADQQTVGVEVG